MPMTVVVTRDVAPRFRGFLASCMLELAPGVYTAPRLSEPVRERIWTVLNEWFVASACTGCIVMTWVDATRQDGQEVRCLGAPPVELRESDGLFLAMRPLTAEDERLLAL